MLEKIKNYWTQDFDKLAFLNPLKALLAFCILLAHWRFSGIKMFGNLYQITWMGANQCYMIVSGMLFYLAYYRKLDSREMSVKTFLWKRLKKLYPLYFLTVIFHIVAIVVANLKKGYFYLDYWAVLRTLVFFGDSFFVNGKESVFNYPAWFFCPLFCAYIVACLIIVLTKKNKSFLWFLFPIAYGFFAYNANSETLLNLPLLFSPRNSLYVGMFFVGFLLMRLLTEHKIPMWLKIVALLFSSFNFVASFVFNGNETININIGENCYSVALWIPLIIALYGSKINLLFDNKFFKHLSAYSIHIWLWHLPFLSIYLFEINDTTKYFYLLCCLAWCLISYLLFLFVPKIISKIKQKRAANKMQNGAT